MIKDEIGLMLYLSGEKSGYYLIYSPAFRLSLIPEGDCFHIAGITADSFYKVIGEVTVQKTEKLLKQVEEINKYCTDLGICTSENTEYACSELSRLLTRLLYEMLKTSAKNENETPNELAEAVKYTEIHIIDGVTSAEVAKRFGFDEIQFKAEFQKYKTMSFDDFVKMQKEHYSIHSQADIQGNHPEWLIHSIVYIDNNFSNVNCLKEARKRSFVSEAVFNREFRMYTGISPAKYMIINRMKSAERRIVNSDEQITVIALESGFYDSSAFIRQFKKTYGLTPAEYRKKHRC